MRPDETDDRRVGTPLIPQRSLHRTPMQLASDRRSTQNAAAQIVRDQLNSIYDGNTTTPTPQTTPHSVQQSDDLHIDNPYERTHQATPQPQADQWKQYHSAWQDYYQKYYERYYVGQVHAAHKALAARMAPEEKDSDSARTDTASSPTQLQPDPTLDKNQALYELRNSLRTKVTETAKKARASRHFMPIAAAIAVVMVFSFLQYNRVLIANVQAYVMPGSIDPQNIIVDPSATASVGPDPKLIIPKINVDVPVIYGVGNDYDSQMAAMEKGVAQFSIPGASSVPGQVGNTVLSGHSSNDILDSGDYKFIFAQLEKLEVGDTIYANYEGKRYTYSITKKEVVLPTEVNKLVYETDKPVLTLITCTPLGTALKRLLVTAEQISPNPADSAEPAPSVEADASAAPIPGNSPTFLQRIFG